MERYPIICDNEWLGGVNEMSNEPNDTVQGAFPAWIHGFIITGYLTKNEDMIRRAIKHMRTIISYQQPDGWSGTMHTLTQNDDQRAAFDIMTVFDMTNGFIQLAGTEYEEEVVEYLYRLMSKLYEWTDKHSPSRWMHTMWAMSMHTLYWLYERRPEEWILALAWRFRCQCFDFKLYYSRFQHAEPTPHGWWNILTHTVNQNIAVSQGPLCYQITQDEEDIRLAYDITEKLDTYHSTPWSGFTGDETLDGDSSLSGTELCSLVELAYSCYSNFAITGDVSWLDRAESQILNAFPATCSPDMTTHQYDQQANQVNLQLYTENGHLGNHPRFSSNNGTAALFGLAPNFPCCLYKMGRGWTQFATHQVMNAATGPAVLFYAPIVVDTQWNGVPVTIEIAGDYPFRENLTVTVTAARPVTFDLQLRIPGWAEGATVNGEAVKAGTMHVIAKEWSGSETVEVILPQTARWVSRPNQLAILKRGPLLYALKIKERWSQVTQTVPEVSNLYENYEIFCESKWNYGVADTNVTFAEHPIGDMPFSPDTPPISATVMCKEIDWPMENGMAAELPRSREGQGEAVPVEFIPYGCTNLRLAELPIL